MKAASWVNVVVGIWLIVAAFALRHAVSATASDFVIGVLLVAFSSWMLAAARPTQAAAGLEIVCGVWLLIAPFLLGYTSISGAVWNDVVTGVIAILAGAAAARTAPRVAA